MSVPGGPILIFRGSVLLCHLASNERNIDCYFFGWDSICWEIYNIILPAVSCNFSYTLNYSHHVAEYWKDAHWVANETSFELEGYCLGKEDEPTNQATTDERTG